ncbi:MAG TPA: TIGR02680 family protein [Longimicrobiales bacterium]|nr:TIGR02680 family protein [Longimicrobiales bacterium]
MTGDLFHGGDRPLPALEERLEALFRAGADVPTRWVPRRLILQNYWLFDYQEFHFGNGRLLLRGPNGSGKTSVLVSAVTLVLDGEKSRYRLDPFGQGGRSMAYYLLGRADADGEAGSFYHDDRTGYVALELQHGGDGRWFTMGVGMRGRRVTGGGTPRVDSWGFVVRDGRRVGRGRPLELTTSNGIPLTRSELADRVAVGGAVLDRKSDYQDEVNRSLFGFSEDDDFAFLVQILLALRSPKLNKELKPSGVAEMLSDSLPPLDPALLDRVTQIMDDIDATRADIAATAENVTRVERVHQAVARYLNQVAQERALDYLEKQTAVEQVGSALVEARERASSLGSEREDAAGRLQAADREQAELKGRLRVLRNHEAYRSREALAAVEADLARARMHQSATTESVSNARRALGDLEKQRSSLRDRWVKHQATVASAADEWSDAARVAAWPHAQQKAADVAAALTSLSFEGGEPPEVGARAVAALAAERRTRLKGVLDALADVSSAETALERASAGVSEAQATLHASHGELRAARTEVDTQRDVLGAEIEAWRRDLQELRVGAAAMDALRERVYAIGEPESLATLLGPMFERGTGRRTELMAERDEARARAALLELRQREVRGELAGWEEREEAVPEPRPGQSEARQRLVEVGVAAVPFFLAIEPREQASEVELRHLQAALRESGLLDALAIRANDALAVDGALGGEAGDRWIRPVPLPEGTATLADLLKPAPCELEEGEVMQALRSVAIERPGAGAAGVTMHGRWCVGPLEGRAPSPANDAALYLGRQARVRERDRQVARLRGEVRQFEEAFDAARREIHVAGERLDRLDDELESLRALRGIRALSGALAVQAERARQVAQRAERLREAEAVTTVARRSLGEARQRHEATLRVAPDARGRDADGVRELIDAGERVVTLAERLEDRLEGLRANREELRRIEAAMGRERVALEDALAREKQAAAGVAETESRARTIEKELGDLGYEDIEREVRRAEQRQEALVKEARALTAEITAVEVRLENTETRIGELEGDRKRCEAERAEARSRLALAVDAYPTFAQAAALLAERTEAAAARAAELLLGRREGPPSDLGRRIADDRQRAFQALSNEIAEARSALIDFHPTLNPENGEVSFRHEGRELPAYTLLEILERHRTHQMSVMREKEEELYEEFFLQEVSGRIREAIERGEESVERVNALLSERPLANDEILSLRWRPRQEIGTEGANHPRLVELLRKPASVLPPEDVRWIKRFFRERVRAVREDAAYAPPSTQEADSSFAEALRAVLDYRRWFSFTIHAKRPGEPLTEITNREFAARSGGEKSLTMFVPLLAAVDARYQAARPDAPKLIGLDEAFAGVDSENINQMYAFMVSLDLSWIMTSEKLWGVGAALPACTTYHFYRQGTLAAVRPWLWDGRCNVEEAMLSVSSGEVPEVEDEASGVA